jgi:hypothetical protein
MTGSVPTLHPRREVFHAEALGWLAQHPAPAGTSVMTSLPDISEIQGLTLEAWQTWFARAAETVMQWVGDEGISIFYQSDIRQRGLWIDKSQLIQQAAARVNHPLLWHKIVCRKPPGTWSLGRPTYSHMLAFVGPRAALTELAVIPSGPDVLPDAGPMSFSRATGLAAVTVACTFLQKAKRTKVVADPFCGQGGILAVANQFGFDALGVDLNARRCRAARRNGLDLEQHVPGHNSRSTLKPVD